MKQHMATAAFAVLATVHAASAQNFPRQEEICVNGIVSKERLAKAYIKLKEEWLSLYVDADSPASQPEYRPQWRRIFVDPNFCANNPGCISLNPETKKPDNSAAIETLRSLRFAMANSLVTQTGAGKPYLMANPRIGSERYFLGPDTQNPIRCAPGVDVPVALKPAPPIKLPIRLRANSDDLNIDASLQKDEFRGVKPATISYTRDGTELKTQTTKLQAALGYPVPINFKPDYLAYFTGELVPYVSASQTIVKTDGRPTTFAAANNVAVGTLVNTQSIFDFAPSVNHVFKAKPQYLWNTKDHSEIASLKLIYEPWVDFRYDHKLNAAFQPGGFFGDSWVRLLFDLRYLVGYYADKGTEPATAVRHTSFSRGGARFGIVYVTPSLGPHLAISVTQTLMHGFTGDVKSLGLFEAVLSYYLDSTSNFALTLSFKSGRDEETAEKTQIWLAGFAAKL